MNCKSYVSQKESTRGHRIYLFNSQQPGQDAPERDSGTQSNPVSNNVDNLAERMDSVTLNDGTVEVCDKQSGPSDMQEQSVVNESHETSETPSEGVNCMLYFRLIF